MPETRRTPLQTMKWKHSSRMEGLVYPLSMAVLQPRRRRSHDRYACRRVAVQRNALVTKLRLAGIGRPACEPKALGLAADGVHGRQAQLRP